MHDLTGFQRDLLYVLAGLEEPIGLEVKAEIESYYGSEIEAGRLYPNLDTLVGMGLVRKDEVDGRTNAYLLTHRGVNELLERREWVNRYLDELHQDQHQLPPSKTT